MAVGKFVITNLLALFRRLIFIPILP